jgi:REP element-mobilizing transposase RayT
MMQLSEAGRIAEQEWLRTAELRPYVDLDTHIVMPNHIHGLIIIRGTVIQHNVSDRSRRHSLPAIVGGFKAATSRRIATLSVDYQWAVWQRSYYERVVRDDDELNSIREYIASNPMRWATHASPLRLTSP